MTEKGQNLWVNCLLLQVFLNLTKIKSAVFFPRTQGKKSVWNGEPYGHSLLNSFSGIMPISSPHSKVTAFLKEFARISNVWRKMFSSQERRGSRGKQPCCLKEKLSQNHTSGKGIWESGYTRSRASNYDFLLTSQSTDILIKFVFSKLCSSPHEITCHLETLERLTTTSNLWLHFLIKHIFD